VPTGRPSTLYTPCCRPLASGLGQSLRGHYKAVRAQSELICKPLEIEDYIIQSFPAASPVRWHLAHCTWFFETIVLSKALPNYKPLNPIYRELFNSYYNSLGAQYPRPNRGGLSRPTVAEVYAYRAYVDEHMHKLFDLVDADRLEPEMIQTIEIGLHHEQQHQELILTDLKHAFSCNPLEPAYQTPVEVSSTTGRMRWADYSEGLREIGCKGDSFCYDNERPRHRAFIEAYELAARLVTNAEYRAFVEDGGYQRAELWLSAGWDAVQQHGWQAPLYWRIEENEIFEFTLHGSQKLDPHTPVCHVSYYEADAYARWAGMRLPTEIEWENAARSILLAGNFVESLPLHPRPLATMPQDNYPRQMFGDVWEWTASPYVGYPGFVPHPGPLGEYNGKFMSNQMVLRGGSCASPQSHLRHTYRNFWAPETRFQFSGIRLAKVMQ
jgi:ergothioneine biosynthesis protein EgtB